MDRKLLTTDFLFGFWKNSCDFTKPLITHLVCRSLCLPAFYTHTKQFFLKFINTKVKISNLQNINTLFHFFFFFEKFYCLHYKALNSKHDIKYSVYNLLIYFYLHMQVVSIALWWVWNIVLQCTHSEHHAMYSKLST